MKRLYRKKRKWTEAEDAILREVDDLVTAAERVGECVYYVKARRVELELDPDPRRVWTDADFRQLKRLARKGLTVDAIADRMFRSVYDVAMRRYELGIDPPKLHDVYGQWHYPNSAEAAAACTVERRAYDFEPLGPARPTDCPPGSVQRIEVYAARIAAGVEMFNDGDAVDWSVGEKVE